MPLKAADYFVFCHKKNLHRKVGGIRYRVRTGIPWEGIPPPLDKANSLLRTFYRWSGKGIFQSIPKS
ncbi:hypothetical protein C7N83_05535, partial [Neisseria iguanae]